MTVVRRRKDWWVEEAWTFASLAIWRHPQEACHVLRREVVLDLTLVLQRNAGPLTDLVEDVNRVDYWEQQVPW
jgi:hypothetical protein